MMILNRVFFKGENLGTISYVLFVWFLIKNTTFLEITNFETIMDLKKSW